jgi:hypothetical protein
MRYTRALHVAFLFVSTILCACAVTARADDVVDDYGDANARVARISLLRGDVSLRRAGNNDWEEATINLPLVEGDQLATARDARLEIQIDARNFVRVAGDSVLRVVTLRDEGIAFSLSEGTATLRLARFDHDKEYFEMDAPKTTVAAERRGLYRLDVERDGRVRVSVRDGGRARIYSETSGFTLRDGRSAELFYSGADEGDWQLSSLPPFDDWDRWTDERERDLRERLRYEQNARYYDQEMWGAEELYNYGDWFYDNNYSCWLWRPSRHHINNYADWSPYRHGNWRWCPPYGWTWVGNEPWGWAPYHYGRWVYHNNSWCWIPRSDRSHQGGSRWRPALVAFVILRQDRRENIAWYPLRYGEREPARNWDGRPVPPAPAKPGDREIDQRNDSAYLRGVTTLPADEFGRRGAHGRAPAKDEAQRIITTEPVRGPLPVRVADTGRTDRVNPGKGDRSVVPTPDRTEPARPLPPERRTGAATRKPGVALDAELQRTRVYNGREPRPAPSAGTTPSRDNNTGAVARPVPPATRPPVEGRVGTGKTDNDDAPPVKRPVRERAPTAQEEQPERPPAPTVNERPERERRPAPPRRVDDHRDNSPPVERTTQPPRPDPPRERPAPPPTERERPAPVRERPEPVRERPAPPPAERERPVERERPPAPEPRPEPAPPREQPPPPREENKQPPPSREREAPSHPERMPGRKGGDRK